MTMIKWIRHKLIQWLVHNIKPSNKGLCDFGRLQNEIKPCDVLLIEGRSRVGEIIKIISQSPWSHSVLYLGFLDDFEDSALKDFMLSFINKEDKTKPLILEALFDEGVVIKPLEKYQDEHIRICHPIGITDEDTKKVMHNALNSLGRQYNARQIFDLMRFFLPVRLLPRTWLSSLFRYKKGGRTDEICSSMLVRAFTHVGFPIRPIVSISEENEIKFFRRNPLLFTPSDFDYSPYFRIIKYPIFGDTGHRNYRDLKWSKPEKHEYHHEGLPEEQ